MRRFIDVVIFKNVINLDKLFTYSSDFEVNNGDFVIVDFNGSLEIALVLKSYFSEEDFDVKKAFRIVDELAPLDKTHLELGLWMKEFYMLTYAKAFNTICDFSKINNLSYKYEITGEVPFEIEEQIQKINSNVLISENEKIDFTSFIDNNSTTMIPNYTVMTGEEVNYFEFVLNLEDSLSLIRKNSSRQIGLLKAIFTRFNNMKNFSSNDVSELNEYDKSVFEELIKKNIFKPIEEPTKEISKSNILLTPKQLEIVNSIKESKYNKFLIRGVTGSGKTEMYFNLIEDALLRGKNAAFLVPEIGLTPQMEIRAKKRFGDLVAIIHSKLSKKKRISEIEKIESNKARILLGTRSAIFFQIPNLDLIIVDEEHDESYKLDSYNKYDVREVARFITEKTPNSKLILGSATPSVDTYYKAINGVYELFTIEERPNDVRLPYVTITDMRQELKAGNTTPFSLELMASMKESLNRNKQVLLFLNRRGYSTFVTCRNCGYTAKCEKCDISTVYHKKNNYLKCHYCGHMERAPMTCPECGSKNIKQFGMGTEKLEEETKNLFPDFNILRIDSDTTSRPEEYKKNVEKILNQEVSIIIGTQMISKGFDFPNIDMVGVIASDLSLNIPEYDSSEKTFQLIMQVAGRSGRDKEQGRVVIQTYNPEHYAILRAKEHDYEGFFKDELRIRNAFSYPPFKRQYIITILNRNYIDGMNTSKIFYDLLEKEVVDRNLSEAVELISHKDRLSVSKLNNRFHIKILLNSTIKHEKFVKKMIYEIFIENKFKVNINNTHIDVISR